ncbi:DUF2141 domain-containing protein [uncultured Eudoraea sp.]|uniref:DUF2141 domain-containing protein n=1 Tax=uncultured Eudoraea sp. TaxID=1035614 RepID=UPI0026285B37|nr:DUF2141 domain-containing protein [uncultured Eudoraea sp.]
MKLLFLNLLLLPLMMFSQNKLSVDVTGVKNDNGSVHVAVYDSSDSFLDSDKMFSGGTSKAQLGNTWVIIDDLPDGEYALAIFHDEDGDDELDTNWIGIPKEPICFSIGKMKTFGPPKYSECSFKVEGDKEIQVSL